MIRHVCTVVHNAVGFGGLKNYVLDGGPDPPMRRSNFSGKDVPGKMAEHIENRDAVWFLDWGRLKRRR